MWEAKSSAILQVRELEAVSLSAKRLRGRARRLQRNLRPYVDGSGGAARDPAPEQRYTESVHSEYSEYGRREEAEEAARKEREKRDAGIDGMLSVLDSTAEDLEPWKTNAQKRRRRGAKKKTTGEENDKRAAAEEDAEDEEGNDEESEFSEDEEEEDERGTDGVTAKVHRRSSHLKTLLTEHELIAMRAQTDFEDELSRFLEGIGGPGMANTGPVARLKFAENAQLNYLTIRLGKLPRRSRHVRDTIKKIKDSLYRLLTSSYVTDGHIARSKVPGAGEAEGDDGDGGDGGDSDTGHDALDKLMGAQQAAQRKNRDAREADLDVFKRWAGKKLVEQDELLQAAGKASKGRHASGEDVQGEGDGAPWACKVCMKVNNENALRCVVCGRLPDAKPTPWGLAKYRPRLTHPRHLHTWNMRKGQTMRRWEREAEAQRKRRAQEVLTGKPMTLREELKEKFYARHNPGAVVLP